MYVVDWNNFGTRYFVNKAFIAIIVSLNSPSISIFRGTTQISPTSSSSSLTLVFKSPFSFLSSSSLAPGHLGIEPFSSYVSRITLFLIGEYFTPARRFSSSHCFFSSSLCLKLIIWINWLLQREKIVLWLLTWQSHHTIDVNFILPHCQHFSCCLRSSPQRASACSDNLLSPPATHRWG